MRIKLTEQQRGEIRKAYADNIPLARIAAKYKIATYYPIRLARQAGIPAREKPPNPKREKKREWGRRNRTKRAAHKAVEYAIHRGDLLRQPCERCGRPDAHAHHDDYSKPLEVKWLCPQYHKDRHRELRCEAA